ncbi:hypothetical protein [Rhodopseudomonas parapalustris]
MIKQIAITAAALAAVSAAVITPATADEVGIGVGPVGVTVGTSHGPYYDRDDHYVVRERRVYREREPDETVVVRRHYRDEPRRRVIIERDDD